MPRRKSTTYQWRVQQKLGENSRFVNSRSGAAEQRARGAREGDSLAAKAGALAGRLEELRKKIVATKQDGAITGEERLREHADILYGAILSWEGRPARYQIERIDALGRELDDVARDVDSVLTKDVAALDAELKAHHLEPIASGGP